MYAHFYHLAETPFNLTPDPKFHYVNESTREAMASILHGLKARKGFLTLIGEAGTGKTTLLKRLVDEIEGTTQVVFVFNPGVSFDELLEFICSELGVAMDGRRRLHMLERLNDYLLEQLTGGRNVVVMIDEAQTLSDGVLEELRLLSNLETSKEKILQILLAGQPELEEKLRRPGLRQLRQRIAVRATLRAMGASEIGAYVQTRLRSAGSAGVDLFTQAALHKIWRVSKGIPRVVNVICDNAMMIAFAEGKKKISYRVAAEAVRDLEGSGRMGALLAAAKVWFGHPWVRYASATVVAALILFPALRWFAGVPVPAPAERQGAVQVTSAVSGRAGEEDNARARLRPARQSNDRPEVSAEAAAPAGVGADTEAARGEMMDLETVADPNLKAVPESTADAAAAQVETETRPLRSLEPMADSEVLRDSIRRAEVIARSTAARLYHDSDTVVEAAQSEKSIMQTPPPTAKTGEIPSPTAAGRAEAKPQAATPQKQEERERQPVMARLSTGGDSRARSLERAAERELQRGDSAVQQRRVAPAVAEDAPVIREKKAAKPGAAPSASAPLAVVATQETEPRSEPSGEKGAAASLAPLERTEVAVEKPVAAKTRRQERRPAGRTESAEKPLKGAPEVAAADEGVGAADQAATSLLLGTLVEVQRGDTVWDIAIEHYGTAGPKTLKRILVANPGMVDPRRLEVGTRVYLPFVRPEQMVEKGRDGTFRLVLASAPDVASMAAVKSWVMRVEPLADLRTEKVPSLGDVYRLLATGIATRQAARELADRLLDAQEHRSEREPATARAKSRSAPES